MNWYKQKYRYEKMKTRRTASGISKQAVKEFNERKLVDIREWKKLPDKQIQAKYDALPVQPPIWKKLSRTQKICFLIGAAKKRWYFAKDTGMGKTLLSLALILYFMKLQSNKRVIVIVPYRSNKDEWLLEIKKHTKLTACVLRGASDLKWEKIENTKAPIVIETYAGLTKMMCDKVTMHRGKKLKRGKLVPSRKKVQKLLSLIDGCILDEADNAATRGKLPFRICRQISKRASVFFSLSGTPFSRDPTPLWGQMYLVDQGATLGPTLGLFRAAFFTEEETNFGIKYNFDKTKMGELHRVLANGMIRFRAKDSDLPTVVPTDPQYVNLPKETWTYYNEALSHMKEGNHQQQMNSFLRMRQISSGFIGYDDDELGVKANFEFPDNPKLEYMLDKIETLDEDVKFLVFHDFVFSGSMISRELEKMGIKHVRLYHKTKDPLAIRKQFDNDPKVRGFVLNTQGAYGLNLQKAQYGFFYERPVRRVLYLQMRRRIERQFSSHDRIWLYDYVARDTVDSRIIKFHNDGAALFGGIVDGKSAQTLMGKLEGRDERMQAQYEQVQ